MKWFTRWIEKLKLASLQRQIGRKTKTYIDCLKMTSVANCELDSLYHKREEVLDELELSRKECKKLGLCPDSIIKMQTARNL